MSVMNGIGVCWRCANLYRTMKLETLGLHGFQYTYLLCVCGHPGIAQDALSKQIYVHKSNVARQLAALEEKGFLERRTDPEDKRSLLVYPTERAYEALPRIREVLAEWERALFEGMDDEERSAAERMTERLAARAKEILDRTERERGDAD